MTVFEAGPDLSEESRASTFHPPTLELLEEVGRDRLQRFAAHLACRHIAAERLAPTLEVPELFAVLRGTEVRQARDVGIRHRDVEAIAEFAQRGVVELLLLVRDVLRLAAGAAEAEVQLGALPVRGLGRAGGVALHRGEAPLRPRAREARLTARHAARRGEQMPTLKPATAEDAIINCPRSDRAGCIDPKISPAIPEPPANSARTSVADPGEFCSLVNAMAPTRPP